MKYPTIILHILRAEAIYSPHGVKRPTQVGIPHEKKEIRLTDWLVLLRSRINKRSQSVWWICWMLQQQLFFLAVVLCKKSLWDWLLSIGLAEVASNILPVWGLSITMLTDSGLGFVLLHVFFSAFCSHQDLYLLTYWHTDLLILLYLTTYTQNSSYIATSERVQQWTVTFKTMASGGQHAIAEAPISHIDFVTSWRNPAITSWWWVNLPRYFTGF